MKKLRLNHEDLRVESFTPVDPERRRGTVMAHSYDTCYATCDPWFGCRTYQGTCHNGGCNGGFTSLCGTEAHTDCPGLSECDNTGNTCDATCSDYGCTGCLNWC